MKPTILIEVKLDRRTRAVLANCSDDKVIADAARIRIVLVKWADSVARIPMLVAERLDGFDAMDKPRWVRDDSIPQTYVLAVLGSLLTAGPEAQTMLGETPCAVPVDLLNAALAAMVLPYHVVRAPD